MKTRHIPLGALPFLLLGCVTVVPSGPAKPVAPELAVSPDAYGADPVGFTAAVIGVPGQKEPNGATSWRTGNNRANNIYTAIAKWCGNVGGKMPAGGRQRFMNCIDQQGKILAQFDMGTAIQYQYVAVLPGEVAEAKLARLNKAAETHRRYMTSGGASGFITLKDGRRIEVLRFGTPRAPIDYDLGGGKRNDERRLYEVRSIERLADGEKGKRGYKVVFADGTVTTGEYSLTNSYVEYAPGTNMGHGFSSLEFGGVGSEQMRLVVRLRPGAKPSNALVALDDIAKVEIKSVSTAPAARIDVTSSDPAIERSVLARWRKVASTKHQVAFNRDAFYSPWCWRESDRPIEVAYLCGQLDAERSIAERTGVFTPQATPASLGSENMYQLGKRTLF